MDELKTQEKTPELQEIALRPIDPRQEIALRESEASLLDAPTIAEDLNIVPLRPTLFGGRGLFLATFVTPVLISAIYLFLIASDRYVSEATYIIRSISSGSAPDLGPVMAANALTRANDEMFAVNEYILSRDALELLLKNYRIRDIFARQEADFINRFPNFHSRDNRENLFRYYRNMVDAYVDPSTSMGRLEVTAFRPADAQYLAAGLLQSAEDLVNRLNRRANEDALKFASLSLEQAKEKVVEAEVALSNYRNASKMVDPTKETSAVMQSITQMTTELARIEASISEQSALAPDHPGLPSMRERARAQRDEIARQWASVVGGDAAIASKLQKFEQLTLEREIAERSLASAELSREKARQEAEHQHLYLQVVVAANMPDQPARPRRLPYFLACVLGSAAVFFAVKSVKEFIEEHAT